MRYDMNRGRRVVNQACVTRMVIDGWRATGRTGDGSVAYEQTSAGWTAQPVLGGLLLSVFDEHRRFVGTVGGVTELP